MPKVFSEVVARLLFWADAGKQIETKANSMAFANSKKRLFAQEGKVEKVFVMQFFLRLYRL